jgi:hypothetical protein
MRAGIISPEAQGLLERYTRKKANNIQMDSKNFFEAWNEFK